MQENESTERKSATRGIATRAALHELGFSPAETWPDSLQFDFGNLLITASEGLTMTAGYAVNFSGVHSTRREITMYDFNLPCKLESLDQGKALISYYLRDFTPDIPCLWLEEGRDLRHLLPWERQRLADEACRKRQRLAYEACPKCRIERDWFRLAAKKLRVLAEAADEAAVIEIAFDGKTILFLTHAETIAMPATGDAWNEAFRFQLKSLTHLPKRLNDSRVSVVIFEGRVSIARRSIPLMIDQKLQ